MTNLRRKMGWGVEEMGGRELEKILEKNRAC